MKKVFLTGVILISVFSAHAQQDSRAKQILDEVSRITRSGESISADFIYSLENNEMDIHEKNEGSISMKGEKYVVSLPGLGWKIYSDGETLWNYMEEGNQVTISNMEDNGSELMNPSNLFTLYEKGFRSELKGEMTIGGTACHQIELFPDSPEFEVTKIILNISKPDKVIKSALLYSTDGNLYGIEVVSMNTENDFSDEFFVFKPHEYADIEIIDFR
jgi:outer membrane lipoprotein carrier protein